MSLGKVARKLKRVGKTACQFRFTSTFEYIDLDCEGSWRPDKLRVIWLRNHRRVQSIDVDWVPTEDRGPQGAEGRATFNPPIAVALIITLYRDSSGAEFEEKEYKYYIESDGPNGKKILASFNCDVAEYAGVPSTRHTLDMTFKTVSKKINKSVLGITLESEYLKQGSATTLPQHPLSAENVKQLMFFSRQNSSIGNCTHQGAQELLDQVSRKANDSDCSDALQHYNRSKNRYPDRVPYNLSRARLRPTGVTGAEYVNASFVDGYKQRNAYLATQAPLKETVNDFWRMVWELKSKAVLMLCNTEENGQPQNPNQNQHPSFVVTLFHYTEWPEHDRPRSTSSILQLIEQVNKVQRSTGNRVITIMCNDGMGRTDTFLCIHAQLERVKSEGLVNFFQFVKSSRIHRPSLVLELIFQD